MIGRKTCIFHIDRKKKSYCKLALSLYITFNYIAFVFLWFLLVNNGDFRLVLFFQKAASCLVLIILFQLPMVTGWISNITIAKWKKKLTAPVLISVYSTRIWNYSWEFKEISLRSILKEFPLMVKKTGLLIWMLTFVVNMGIRMSISPPRV